MTRKVSKNSFEIYVSRVLKIYHPTLSIGRIAREQISGLAEVMARELAAAAHKFSVICQHKTITARDVQSGTRLVLNGELVKHAVSEGTKAIVKYNSNSANSSRQAPVRQEFHAGLKVSVSLARKFIHAASTAESKIAVGAPVYLAAVIEYLISEILELAGNQTLDANRKIITIRDTALGVMKDEELNAMMCRHKIHFVGGGVVPHIFPELIPSEEKKTKNANQRRKGKGDSETKKSHRFLPGTVALTKIRKYQKTGNLLMPRLPTERLMREILRMNGYDDIRFPERTTTLFQYYIEEKVVQTFNVAQKYSIHAGRESVNDKDVMAAIESENCYLKMKDVIVGETISQPCLERLARRGGVKRLTHEVFDHIRSFIYNIILSVSDDMALICQANKSKTLTPEFLRDALRYQGVNLLIYTA